jgi:hypothetical protein
VGAIEERIWGIRFTVFRVVEWLDCRLLQSHLTANGIFQAALWIWSNAGSQLDLETATYADKRNRNNAKKSLKHTEIRCQQKWIENEKNLPIAFSLKVEGSGIYNTHPLALSVTAMEWQRLGTWLSFTEVCFIAKMAASRQGCSLWSDTGGWGVQTSLSVFN